MSRQSACCAAGDRILRPFDVHSSMGAALMAASAIRDDPLRDAAAALTSQALLVPRKRRHDQEVLQVRRAAHLMPRC